MKVVFYVYLVFCVRGYLKVGQKSIFVMKGSFLIGIFMNRFCAKFIHWIGLELGSDRALLSGYLKDKVGRKDLVRLRRRGLVASPAPPGSSLLTTVMGGGIENIWWGWGATGASRFLTPN